MKAIEDIDPRPVEYRRTASQNLPDFLNKICGEQLCISLLLDLSFRYSDEPALESSRLTPRLPRESSLKDTIVAFNTTLSVTEDDIREIEQSTREQRTSSQLYQARCFRLTSSLFDAVLQRQANTPPDSLVLRIIQPRKISSAPIEWGINHESVALKEYIKYQHQHGHEGLVVTQSGFLVSQSTLFLLPRLMVLSLTHQHLNNIWIS